MFLIFSNFRIKAILFTTGVEYPVVSPGQEEHYDIRIQNSYEV